MKINWITGAFMVFGVFVAFMIFLVVFASMQNNELITDKYYEQELNFQKTMAKKKRADNLAEKVRVENRNNQKQLVFHFPRLDQPQIFGTIYFYKPDNQQHDRLFKFQTTNQQYTLPNNLPPGGYLVKIDWAASVSNDFSADALKSGYYSEIKLAL